MGDFFFDTSGALNTSGGGGFDLGDLSGLISSIGSTFSSVWKSVNAPTTIPVPGTAPASNKPAPTVTPTTAPATSGNGLLLALAVGGVAFGLAKAF